jgi:DNA polymerase-4
MRIVCSITQPLFYECTISIIPNPRGYNTTVNHRKIIHLDLDAFFCSVEEMNDPTLKGKPFAVGGPVGTRSVVASCSYAARQMGIHSAMPIDQAVKLCPGLIIVHGKHSEYGKHSENVMAILNRFSGLVEQVSIDEAFIDVSDLPEDGEVIARKIQATIINETGLPCSLGVARNKLVAKIACDFGKGKHQGTTSPCAITVVMAGEEAKFLAPLPARAMWGIGPKTAEALQELGIHTIGEIADQSESFLTSKFGKYGWELVQRAKGIDHSPISLEHGIKSISQETTFETDIRSEKEIVNTIRKLSSQVSYRLRKHQLIASTVKVKIRWPDFTTITRQYSLKQATDQDGVIFSIAKGLFMEAWSERTPVRLIGVGTAGFSEGVHQLSLWDTPNEKEHRLLTAMDEIRKRFGKEALKRGLEQLTKDQQPNNISRTNYSKPIDKV